MKQNVDIINPAAAGTLAGLFRERTLRTPDAPAYIHFSEAENRWVTTDWRVMKQLAGCWQEAFRREALQPGDRVAVMLRNCREWVLFDIAATALGLVTVPLFVNDRPENFAYILKETESKLLLIEGLEQWKRVEEVSDRLDFIQRIVTLERVCEKDCDPRLAELGQWLPQQMAEFSVATAQPGDMATIVYTSGTTGNPKGVMLSHSNILQNAYAALQRVPVYHDDLFLSFLPLSHTFERTVGYYIPIMAGATVAYARSVEKLAEDLEQVKPTVLVSVPRIFERVHKRIMVKLNEEPVLAKRFFYLAVGVGWKRFNRRQGRDGWGPSLLLWPFLQKMVAEKILRKLGGRLRLAVSGGAPLSPSIARVFIGLGVNLVQGYGMTEASPIIAVNSEEENLPSTVGPPVNGVQAKVTDDGELIVRGPSVMLGYWKNRAATEATIDGEGWLHTGDKASIDGRGHISITGRLKEIIVLSNGEKVPPEDVELAIAVNPLFDQVLVVGEGRPYLAALVVVNEQQWEKIAAKLGLDPRDPAALESEEAQQVMLAKIGRRLARFPGYAQIRRVYPTLIPWTINDGLITATLKLRRRHMIGKFAKEVEALYTGHD